MAHRQQAEPGERRAPEGVGRGQAEHEHRRYGQRQEQLPQGDVELARGNQGFLSFSFGDILNTFNLDFLLSAAETDGLLRIVSTPRVTTQNLQQASIRSGLQIPVQTVANNTVTVQYVDATVRLQVTPQITAEQTVIMKVVVENNQPSETLTVPLNNPAGASEMQISFIVFDLETVFLIPWAVEMRELGWSAFVAVTLAPPPLDGWV